MNPHPIPVQPPGLNLGDVYYIIFRHKWKIVLCTILGVLGAIAMYKLNPPPFVSEAKLYVRYVISEGKAIGRATQESGAKSPDERGETIMKTEAEILTSLDLARQVALSVGPEKILEKVGGGSDVSQALALIKANLKVIVSPGSSVMHVLFKHPDPALVQPVLREVIDRYLKLHVDTHTASGMLGEIIAQETDQMRSRLLHTEDELRKVSKGIISLEDAKKSYAEQISGIRRELFSAHADLAQRTSLLEELAKQASVTATSEEPELQIPAETIREYSGALHRIDSLRRMEQELLTQFTAESARVQEVQAQIGVVEATLRGLSERHPRLSQITLPSQRSTQAIDMIDPATIRAQVTSLQTKIKVLTAQFDQLRGEAAQLDQMEGSIVELRRKRELEEASFRLYSQSLEQSRINETLGNGRVSNISEIQKPSPPFSEHGKTNKTVGLILAGGLLAGIGWAFMIEMYLDRSIKRPIDVERALNIPLFLAIPTIKRKYMLQAAPLMLAGANGTKNVNGHNGAPGPNGDNGSSATPTGNGHPLEVYHETLRDRLIGYFESINLAHKPKLVAITGLGAEAGVTTTAAGLARSLSETGEGNVLLVDMNVGQGVAQQFMKGKAVCGLDEVLETRDRSQTEDKLYVVSENNSDRLSRNMPQRFSKLVPKLKASDFDYILFDMPPISQISITPRLAGFMDMVLLVVESEKTDRDLVQRAASLLSESRAHVGVVLNKTKGYVPAGLYQDSLASC